MHGFKKICSAAVVLTLAVCFGDQAMAQSYGVAQSQLNNAAARTRNNLNQYSARNNVLRRETVSPYLRLAANGGSSAFQVRNIRQQISNRSGNPGGGRPAQPLTTRTRNFTEGPGQGRTGFTGHPTRYNMTSHYFQTVRGL